MRLLMLGLGSIGQRHLRNFYSLAGDAMEVYAVRSLGAQALIENGEAIESDALSTQLGFIELGSLDEAFALGMDCAVVSNPTALHVEATLACVRRDIDCLVEKPLAASWGQMAEWGEALKAGPGGIAVGYQFRFHPAYRKAKALLNNGEVGRIQSVRFEWGTYLPSHHPYEDYRRSYAARADLGGGVLNGLSHDLDLMGDLLGSLSVVHACQAQRRLLEMGGVEETVFAQLTSDEGVSIQLYLSYADACERHGFEVIGDKGVLRCDFTDPSCLVVDASGRELHSDYWPSFDRNQLFIEEMRSFLGMAEGGDLVGACDLEGAMDCVRIVESIRSFL